MPSPENYASFAVPPTVASHRRQFGLLLGTLTGFAFTLVMQIINPLVMPGILFYQPPFGVVGNIVLGTVLGALVGYITAWAETGVKGIVLGSVTGALVLSVAGLLTGRTGPEVWLDKIVSMVIIFVPIAALIALPLVVFRWLVNREEESYRESLTWVPPARFPRIALPVLLVLFAAAAGLTAMYNDLARAVTPRMDALLAEARRAPSAESLPAPLRTPEVPDFYAHARQPYTLQWDKDDSNKFAIPRPNTSRFDQSTVIARFADGYLLACVYPDPTYEPRCKGYAKPGE